jgi:hypothetical protein
MYSPSAHRPEQAPVSLPERRSFLAVVLAAAGGLVTAALAIPLMRFATFPLRDSAEAASWSDVGKIDEFHSLKEPVARVIDVKRVEGWRSSVVQNGVYVVPNGSVFGMSTSGLRCALDRQAGQIHLPLPWRHLHEYRRACLRASAPRYG